MPNNIILEIEVNSGRIIMFCHYSWRLERIKIILVLVSKYAQSDLNNTQSQHLQIEENDLKLI